MSTGFDEASGPTTAVIGGGLAGLVAARRLARKGERVVVFEASPAPGGMIAVAELGGVRVDGGAEGYATRSRAAAELCHELGLEVAGPSGTPHVWWPDQIVPLADGVLGIPGSLEDPALAVLTDEQRARLAQDLELDAEVGQDAQTAGQLAAARMGEAVPRKLMAPLTTGVYRSDPMDVPLAVFAPKLKDALARTGSLLAAVASLRAPGTAAVAQPVGGMFRLIEALAAGIDVRPAHPVQHLRHEGTGYRIETPKGDLHVERVVIATPAAPAAHLLGGLGVQIPVHPTTTSHVALLASDHPALDQGPVGSGLLMGERDSRIVAKALTHYSWKWPWVTGCHILRLSYSGDVAPARALVVEDASRLTQIDLSAHAIGYTVITHEMPAKITPDQRDETLSATQAAGVDVVGAWLDGNGIGPVIEATERL